MTGRGVGKNVQLFQYCLITQISTQNQFLRHQLLIKKIDKLICTESAVCHSAVVEFAPYAMGGKQIRQALRNGQICSATVQWISNTDRIKQAT